MQTLSSIKTISKGKRLVATNWGECERAPTWWSVWGLCLSVCLIVMDWPSAMRMRGPRRCKSHVTLISLDALVPQVRKGGGYSATYLKWISKDKRLKPNFLKKEGNKDILKMDTEETATQAVEATALLEEGKKDLEGGYTENVNNYAVWLEIFED